MSGSDLARPRHACDATAPASDFTALGRDRVERVLRLATLLRPGDRLLLEAILDRGLSAAEVAMLTDRSASSVRRQVRRLILRLESPHVQWILRERQHWPREYARLAEARYIRGLSQRATAQRLGCSLHRVREIDHDLRARMAMALDEQDARPMRASSPRSTRRRA